MKQVITILSVSFLLCLACTDDNLSDTNAPTDNNPEVEAPDAYRDKIRTQPYPKESNELMTNPAPLIVPQTMKTAECLQFNLARTADFTGDEALLTQPQPYCMYNLHKALEAGTWYWRFRSVTADGTPAGEWSDTYCFNVKEDLPQFVTPPFSDFLNNTPRTLPRLYCFLNPRIDKARLTVTSHAEYRQLIGRANQTLSTDYTTLADLCSQANELHSHATWLYDACYLTQQETYAEHLHQMLTAFTNMPPTDAQLFADNFTATDIAFVHAAAYDLLYDRLTAAERTAAEEVMLRLLRRYYNENIGYQENHIFDNHFWQQNIRIYFQCAFLLYNHPTHADEVLPMLEYYYELWTARAPAGGFNRDGVWHNGAGYLPANVKTLAYMPALLSYVARFDFLQHPWYRNAGRSLVYSYPPHSRSNSFGDASEQGDQPSRLVAALADYLARETNDGYAGWYASECASLLNTDYELRLYRMCADRNYATTLPANAPHLVWYRDAGEVAMHSHPADTENDLALAFRSSTYGSGSHTTASQNAFNLLYKGKDVYRSSGYYQNFSDAHNLMSYRHTRAHNTLLVNGIGQPYSTKGYGCIVRTLGGDHISYTLGDASHAYCGISDDPMWETAFEAAGIKQTPEYGFGETPLTRYRRHVLMLHPRTVVIYDELEASEPVRWDWLLHSPTRFTIDRNQQMLSTSEADDNFVAVTQLFSSDDIAFAQTDQFAVPPAISGPEYPNQWHLTATVESRAQTRFLAIIRVGDTGSDIPAMRREGKDTFKVGDWTITAGMDTSQAASLCITDQASDAWFSYGTDQELPSGYVRESNNSAVLHDETNGSWQTEEMGDVTSISTRTLNK